MQIPFPCTIPSMAAGAALTALLALSACSQDEPPAAEQAREQTKKAAVNPPLITDGLTGMELVYINGGTFEMGDLHGDGWQEELPVHKVTVSDFYIGKTEVTQTQWEQVMGYNNAKFKGPDHPADSVSWDEIQVFVTKLEEQSGVKYRLPTEAEWEYAARAGTRDRWAGTDNGEEVGDYAWYLHNSDAQSHPVGTKKPNPWGLHDISGSLWEWVQDRFNYPYPSGHQIDPKGADTSWEDDWRAYRGGAWDYIPRIIRIASRSGNRPEYQRPWIGFRLAKDAATPE